MVHIRRQLNLREVNNGAKKINKNFLLIILILLAIVTISFFVENNVKSYNIQDNFDIYDFVPISGTEFQSEDLVVGKKTAFVYSALSEGTALNNKDEYIITIGKVTGINNNRYEIFSFTPQEDNFILSNKYSNVFDYPQFEMKSGNSYYKSVNSTVGYIYRLLNQVYILSVVYIKMGTSLHLS